MSDVVLRLGSIGGLSGPTPASFHDLRAPAFLLEATANVAKDGVLICALEGPAESARLVAIYEDQGQVYDCEREEWADACLFHGQGEDIVFQGVGLEQADRLGFTLGPAELGYVLLSRIGGPGHLARARDESWEREGVRESSVLIASRSFLGTLTAPLGHRSRLSPLAARSVSPLAASSASPLVGRAS